MRLLLLQAGRISVQSGLTVRAQRAVANDAHLDVGVLPGGRGGGRRRGGRGLGEALRMALSHAGGPQVDDEGEDVKGEDEGDDPLEVGGDVLVAGEGQGGKGDGQDDLDEDEGELDPEGGAKDAVAAVSCAKKKVAG